MEVSEGMGFTGDSVIKNLPGNAGVARDAVSIPGLGRSSGERNGNHSSILAWEIPWTEERDRLQSMRSQKSQIKLSD